MYKITEKVALNPTVTKMVIEAPLIAKKAKPGQFIIVRPFEDSERIPLTVAGYDREKGTVDIIFQIVGGTTMASGVPGRHAGGAVPAGDDGGGAWSPLRTYPHRDGRLFPLCHAENAMNPPSGSY